MAEGIMKKYKEKGPQGLKIKLKVKIPLKGAKETKENGNNSVKG